jgi:hypothetical protein
MKTFSPSAAGTISCLLALHTVNPTFFSALSKAGAVSDRPTNVEFPEAPIPPVPGSSKDEISAYEKLLTSYEKALLAINPSIGSSPEDYYGHSLLELDFDANWPKETGHPAVDNPKFPTFDAKTWCQPKSERKTVFEGVGFVDFRDDEKVVSTRYL